MPSPTLHPEVVDLIERSRSLGSEPTITNYGGGNTSCKIEAEDPVTGEHRRLLYVKGSGGHLGSLTADGLAVLDLDRVRSLDRLYTDQEHEDELVSYLGYCRFGPPGPAPSLDTAFHALLPAAHIDHMHAAAVITLATSAEGAKLTAECFQGRVGWVDWRRPGFTLAHDLLALLEDEPTLDGVVLGGHGLVSWGDSAAGCEDTTRSIIATAERFVSRRTTYPAARVVDQDAPRRATAVAPILRAACSSDRAMVAEFRCDPDVLAYLGSPRAAALADAGTSCPDHFLRTRARPLFVPVAEDAPVERIRDEIGVATERYRRMYRDYYRRRARADSPPMRGADPTVALIPGLGMWAFGPTARDASITADLYHQAMGIMHSADQLGGYEPLSDDERFRIEYWDLEVAKLDRRPPPPPLQGRIALVAGAASGIGRSVARTLADAGAAVTVADLDHERAREAAADLGSSGSQVDAVAIDLTDERSVRDAVGAVVLARGGLDFVVNSAGIAMADGLEHTTAADWDSMAAIFARGSFLLSREAARVMVDQGMGGHIVHIVSKNAVVATPGNAAYASAKAAQLHLVRLLATELAPHGIQVNAVNPDGVVRGSGLFDNEWGRARAEAHGVTVEDLPAFYAARTLLGEEVRPEHVARAVLALVDGTLPRTTGSYLPVDGGLTAAFPR